MVLTATVLNSDIPRWYTTQTNIQNQNYEDEGVDFTPGVTDVGTYTYYVTSYNPLTGCESSTSDPVTFNIYQSPEFMTQLNTVEAGSQYPFEVIDVNMYEITMVDEQLADSYTYDIVYEETSESIIVTDKQFTITKEGYYSITATSEEGCSRTIENLYIKYIDIEIPNVFSPGDTGLTIPDHWYPDNLKSDNGDPFVSFQDIEVMIFDRYGRLIKEYTGIQDRNAGEGWDGTYKGEQMPTGDYWYHIRLNDDKGREYTGHFTLYRNETE